MPDVYALQVFKSGIIDAAISVTAAYTPDQLGLAHEVVTPAEHLLLFGVAAAPLEVPADFAGPEANMRNQQRGYDAFDMQQRFIPVIRSATVTGIPARILRLAEVNGSLRHHLHVRDIFADLSAKLPLAKRDLDFCIEGIKKPYLRGSYIRPFVADQLRLLGYLATAGQAPSNRDAVALMKSSFTNTDTDRADFGPVFLSSYARMDQTPHRLSQSGEPS